jgi:hypothetical protein
VTQETSDTEIEEMTHHVPETRRIVQGSPAKNDNKLPPTDTIEISDTNIEDGEIIQPVPETRRIVQKAKLKEKVNSTPTDMIESLTGLVLWPYIYGYFLGSFFTGAYLPQKTDLLPRLERERNSVQKHVPSY